MTEVTRILSQIEVGDPSAAEQLLPLVYDELRKLAAAKMSQEKLGQTLQATALVHEAYLRLVDGPNAQDWASRGHFFGAAAEAMRRILVEGARRKGRRRHGGGRRRVELDDATAALDGQPDELLDLDEALTALDREEPDVSELVKLRYFAGLTLQEAAAVRGISLRTTNRQWAFARAWLFQRLNPEEPESG